MRAPVPAEAGDPQPSAFWKLVLGSVGVVYGDIGTSPLYALREALARRRRATGWPRARSSASSRCCSGR